MAKEATPRTEGTKEYRTIEEWAGMKETDGIILEGVKAFKDWKAGKSVTEKDYDAAVSAFCKAPADGRK